MSISPARPNGSSVTWRAARMRPAKGPSRQAPSREASFRTARQSRRAAWTPRSRPAKPASPSGSGWMAINASPSRGARSSGPRGPSSARLVSSSSASCGAGGGPLVAQPEQAVRGELPVVGGLRRQRVALAPVVRQCTVPGPALLGRQAGQPLAQRKRGEHARVGAPGQGQRVGGAARAQQQVEVAARGRFAAGDERLAAVLDRHLEAVGVEQLLGARVRGQRLVAASQRLQRLGPARRGAPLRAPVERRFGELVQLLVAAQRAVGAALGQLEAAFQVLLPERVGQRARLRRPPPRPGARGPAQVALLQVGQREVEPGGRLLPRAAPGTPRPAPPAPLRAPAPPPGRRRRPRGPAAGSSRASAGSRRAHSGAGPWARR